MSVESTVDYAGYALSTTGTPLPDRAVTLKRVDTLATVVSTTTDANGKWLFNDIAPTPLVKAEISAGTTPQIAVKACWSGDVWSLYVREKLTAAPAAIFNLPPVANIYANGVHLAEALGPGMEVQLQDWADERYVNLAGDVMTGALTLNSTLHAIGLITADAGLTADGDVYSTAQGRFDDGLNVGGGAFLVANDGKLTMTNDATLNGNVNLGQVSIPTGNLTMGAGKLYVHGGTNALPGIATAGDHATGIRLAGGNQGLLVAGGNEIARFWMNGANTQFSTSGAETYIGTNKLMLSAALLTAAASVTGVVRKIQVCDAAGNPVGWVPVYGAAG